MQTSSTAQTGRIQHLTDTSARPVQDHHGLWQGTQRAGVSQATPRPTRCSNPEVEVWLMVGEMIAAIPNGPPPEEVAAEIIGWIRGQVGLPLWMAENIVNDRFAALGILPPPTELDFALRNRQLVENTSS